MRFPALEGEEGQKTWYECVKTDVSICGLTAKAEMHTEPVFDIAWCYQPHRMGHEQRHNLKMDMGG